jgi:hypothetical protein
MADMTDFILCCCGSVVVQPATAPHGHRPARNARRKLTEGGKNRVNILKKLHAAPGVGTPRVAEAPKGWEGKKGRPSFLKKRSKKLFIFK